jgi:hypothetical protein
MKSNLLVFLFVLSILLFANGEVFGASLQLTILPQKPIYNLGETIAIEGNLTLEGTKVSDGLVAVQINNPRNETAAVRTLSTGAEPPKPWVIEILEFNAVDAAGNPKSSFAVNENMGFKATIRNNALSSYPVLVPIYAQYSNGVPFTVFIIYSGSLSPGQSKEVSTWPISIPYNAPLGVASAYASALTDLPKANGYAYCPENKTTFVITSTLGATSLINERSFVSVMSNSDFNMTLSISSRGGILGNYTVNATSRYSFWLVTNSTLFTSVLITDITGRFNVPDGKVDIIDLALTSSCFGSYPGHPKWDPRADINKDGKVDIQDLSRVSADYGKYGTLP